MRNCIASYTPAIMTGGCFLCSWQGPERGTVELVRDGRGGWTLGSVAGHRNAPLSLPTVKGIVDTLMAAFSEIKETPFGPPQCASQTEQGPLGNVEKLAARSSAEPPSTPEILGRGAAGRVGGDELGQRDTQN